MTKAKIVRSEVAKFVKLIPGLGSFPFSNCSKFAGRWRNVSDASLIVKSARLIVKNEKQRYIFQ